MTKQDRLKMLHNAKVASHKTGLDVYILKSPNLGVYQSFVLPNDNNTSLLAWYNNGNRVP